MCKFWNNFEITDDCWEWTAAKNRDGYGQFWLNGKQHLAHRFSFEFFFFESPAGKSVCHTCDNSSCVNPNHLYLGTTATNMRDKALRFRGNRGEKHNMARLTEADVLSIRAEYAKGGISVYAIAKKYKVNWFTVDNVIKRKSWKHV